VSSTDLCAHCGGDCPMTDCPTCGGCENTGEQPCPDCQVDPAVYWADEDDEEWGE
jgi:hypothetical protein